MKHAIYHLIFGLYTKTMLYSLTLIVFGRYISDFLKIISRCRTPIDNKTKEARHFNTALLLLIISAYDAIVSSKQYTYKVLYNKIHMVVVDNKRTGQIYFFFIK